MSIDSLQRGVRALGFFVLGTVLATPASAAVWGYVDEAGRTHFASEPLDDRYQLFFKGDFAAEPKTEERKDAAAPPRGEGMQLLERFARGQDPGRFEKLIEEHATRQALDPALVKAVVAVESGFSPAAVSPKGARGLMQVMPETAARYGVTGDKRRSAEQKLLDPAVSLQVGTRYLRDLLGRFAGDLALTLAAYNAGEMAVERYKNRVPPYPETVEYVKRVQQIYAALKPAPVAAAPVAPGSGKRIHGRFLALEPLAPGSPSPAL